MARRNPWAWFVNLPFRHRLTIIVGIFVPVMIAIVVGIFVPVMIAIVGGIYTELKSTWFNESELELVDVSLKEQDRATILDIKLRNVGEKVAYLKEADFKVAKTWELQSNTFPVYLPSSRNYDMLLAPTGPPYKKTMKLSQIIGPNKVDRFTFTIGLDPPKRDPGNVQYVFLLSLDLIYDEDDKVVSGGKILIVIHQARGPSNYFFPNVPPNSSIGRRHSHNQEVLGEIRTIEGMKSESLKKLIRHTSQKDRREEP
jgi:hypothetical protein